MARRQIARPAPDLRNSLLATYAINDAMNQLILAELDPRAWRASPPFQRKHEGRTIAAIFAHLHNIRLAWLKHSASHLRRPAPLDPARCTIKQAVAAFKKSGARCLEACFAPYTQTMGCNTNMACGS